MSLQVFDRRKEHKNGMYEEERDSLPRTYNFNEPHACELILSLYLN